MKTFRTVLWGAIGPVLVLSGCLGGKTTPLDQTTFILHNIQSELLEFQDTTGSLPPSLKDLCLSNNDCEGRMQQWMDGWGTLIELESKDVTFILKSAGPDKLWDTADDESLDRSQFLTQVALIAGCYRLDQPLPLIGSDFLELKTTERFPGKYEASPESTALSEPHWHPVPGGFWVRWFTMGYAGAKFTTAGDTIRGTMSVGSDFWPGRSRSHSYLGTRIPCEDLRDYAGP